MPIAASQLSFFLVSSILLSVAALSWKRRRIGSKWSATNLIHLRDFIMEEVLTDEVTPSPDGYTVLLGRFTWQGRDEKAILKMRPEQLPARDNAVTREHSHTGKGILKNGFWVSCKRQSLHRALSHLSLRVQLESGAEYGYYSGSLSPLSMAYLGIPLTYHIEVIAPASPRQIVRAHLEKRVLIRESPALYRVALGPLADEVRGEGRSLQWVYNILEHKKEAERIVFEDPPDPLDSSKGFVLVPDPKWKSHPDPSRTPKEEWRHHPSTSGLACLAIVHDRSIGSLRDLRRRHLPLLQSLLAKGLAAIEAVYGVGKEEVRVFVHYVPQFFHFHVHFSRLNLAHGIEVERAHLLSDVIEKIERAPVGEEYYENASISYTVKKSEELYGRLQKAGAWAPV